MELKSIIKEAQANFGEFNVKFVDDHDNLLGLSNKSMGEALSAMDVMLQRITTGRFWNISNQAHALRSSSN